MENMKVHFKSTLFGLTIKEDNGSALLTNQLEKVPITLLCKMPNLSSEKAPQIINSPNYKMPSSLSS